MANEMTTTNGVPVTAGMQAGVMPGMPRGYGRRDERSAARAVMLAWLGAKVVREPREKVLDVEVQQERGAEMKPGWTRLVDTRVTYSLLVSVFTLTMLGVLVQGVCETVALAVVPLLVVALFVTTLVEVKEDGQMMEGRLQ